MSIRLLFIRFDLKKKSTTIRVSKNEKENQPLSCYQWKFPIFSNESAYKGEAATILHDVRPLILTTLKLILTLYKKCTAIL